MGISPRPVAARQAPPRNEGRSETARLNASKNTTSDDDEHRLLACFHEAGHCFVRWAMGHRTERLVVQTPNEVRAGKPISGRNGRPFHGLEGASVGYGLAPNFILKDEDRDWKRVDQETFAAFISSARLRLEMALVEAAGGVEAEARHLGVARSVVEKEGGAEDVERVRLWCRFYVRPADATRVKAEAQQRAQALVIAPPAWAAITAVALALKKAGELEWLALDRMMAQGCGCMQPSLAKVLVCWPTVVDLLRRDFHSS